MCLILSHTIGIVHLQTEKKTKPAIEVAYRMLEMRLWLHLEIRYVLFDGKMVVFISSVGAKERPTDGRLRFPILIQEEIIL